MAKKQKKETFQEMYERYKNDPKIMEKMMSEEYEKLGYAMFELSSAIVSPCIDYANEHGDDDKAWTYTILISLARATCKLLYVMQKTQAQAGKDVFKFYTEELLPLCRQISDSESDELMAERERMAKEAEEKKGGVSQKRKEKVILAIADPEMTVDAIIDKFFKKDMTAEQRKMVADYIEKVRVDHADKLQKLRELTDELQKLREHTDENGNYKA